MQACDARRILDIGDIHCARTIRFRDEDPDEATIIEIRQGVNEEIREIPVVGIITAPPHDGTVNDIAVVDVNDRLSRLLFYCAAKILIGIVVDIELLDNLSRLESEAHRHDAQPPSVVSARCTI